MKEATVRSILALTTVVAALASAGVARAQDKPILPIPGWNPDLPAGFAEAKRTGKPLLVVFR